MKELAKEEGEGFGCGSEDAIGGTMPRFMPVQCSKCSVLQVGGFTLPSRGMTAQCLCFGVECA